MILCESQWVNIMALKENHKFLVLSVLNINQSLMRNVFIETKFLYYNEGIYFISDNIGTGYQGGYVRIFKNILQVRSTGVGHQLYIRNAHVYYSV